jgi:hypothetical protein
MWMLSSRYTSQMEKTYKQAREGRDKTTGCNKYKTGVYLTSICHMGLWSTRQLNNARNYASIALSR